MRCHTTKFEYGYQTICDEPGFPEFHYYHQYIIASLLVFFYLIHFGYIRPLDTVSYLIESSRNYIRSRRRRRDYANINVVPDIEIEMDSPILVNQRTYGMTTINLD